MNRRSTALPVAAKSWLELSLSDQRRSLIEASAGTGKTWTIAVLYLRLLLERGLSPKKIVVATFTEPAAQELRERIRTRIQEALRWGSDMAMVPDQEREDPAFVWLNQRWASAEGDQRQDVKLLNLALAELDSGPIGTLHSICQRILKDFPFETGSPFKPGTLSSGNDLLAECALDLVRIENQEAQADDTLPSFKTLLKDLNVLLRPSVSVPDLDPAEIRLQIPQDAGQRLREFSQGDDKYTKTGGGKPESKLKNALMNLADWCDSKTDTLPDASLGHLKDLEARLLPEAWQALRHGADIQLVNEILAHYQKVQAAPTFQRLAARQRLARGMFEERLVARNQLTFDSLITRAYATVTGNAALAALLCETWPVAMIDEFQDTDAFQYGVLDAIYRNPQGAIRGHLVMIGDPKQAIYGFRGGDIETYTRAANSATDLLVLDTNRRSDPLLVQAFNQFYARAGVQLSGTDDHAIRYHEVKWVDPKYTFQVNGETPAQPFTIHYLDTVSDKSPERRARALDACANQIAQMLDDGARSIDGNPLQPGDIAVLLPGHKDVGYLRDALADLAVPSVGGGRASVFSGPWAEALQTYLYAVQHPHAISAVSAALATRLGGMDFSDLQALREDAVAQSNVTRQFEHLNKVWASSGVLALVTEILSASAARLLACRDGERAMTDLRHLGELLQVAEEERHGASQVLAWLSQQRDLAGTADEQEASQLRMESDAHRVKLMTLHASKGLEFPVVFLPLMWAHEERNETYPLVKDEHFGRKIGIGSAEKTASRKELQDERFRVLYVALTRAQHECHVYALPPGRIAHAKANSPKTGFARSALDISIERLIETGGGTEELARGVVPLGWSEGWPWSAPDRQLAEAVEEVERVALPMPNRMPVYERLHSFSSLSQHRYSAQEESSAADEETEVDAEEAMAAAPEDAPVESDTEEAGDAVLAPHPVLKRLSRIKGADFGNALHQVFEERQVGQPINAQLALIDQALLRHGVHLADIPRDEVIAAIAERVGAALDADLGDGLRLGELSPRALRAEMAFHYSIDGVQVAALRRVCEANHIAFPGKTSTRLYGLMHGKIDLVLEHAGRFHVLDYKGNQLGDRETGGTLSDYAGADLDRVMSHHFYELQALFYTVAVDRMLRARVPGYVREQHLGETIYFFVRAAGLASGAGVWRKRFDDSLLDAVDNILAGRQQATPGPSMAMEEEA